MRSSLKQRNGQRTTFLGTFERFGTKPGWRDLAPTVLLVHIRTLDGEALCDHLWFNLTKQFDVLCLKPGDVVQFDARVTAYEKGYKGWRDDVSDAPIMRDYKLSYPTKVCRISDGR